MPKKKPNYITDTEKRYIEAFLELGNERKALDRVFGPGAPLKKHRDIMRKPLAKEYLKQLNERYGLSDEMEAALRASHRRLRTLMTVNINDIIDPETGELRPDVPDEFFDAVKSIKYDAETGRVTQITLVDKLRPVELALKVEGELNKRVDVNMNVSVTQQLLGSDVDESEVEALLESYRAKRALPEVVDAEVADDAE